MTSQPPTRPRFGQLPLSLHLLDAPHSGCEDAAILPSDGADT